MTADAKIGLLLGLVFIFIIAFIINGLPSFWSHPSTANATPAVSKSTDSPGLAQDARQKLDWQKQLGQMTTPTAPPLNTTPVSETQVTTPTVAKDVTTPSLTPPVDQPLTPVSTTLDQSIQKLVSMQTGSASEAMDTSVPSDKSSSVAPLITKENPTQASEVAKSEKTTPAPTPAAVAKKDAVKEYVVQPGEDLGSIAKKVYGSVGKNPELISAYNHLSSKDVIAVGQKLKIPPAPTPATTVSAPKPASVMPGSHFEAVSGISNRPQVTKAVEVSQSTEKSAGTPVTPAQADGRSYVVQSDDTLWKIAAKQLGSGARYEEIVKLNGLKNKDNVTPGTRLKLPSK
jgi:nucleoid-associated protein YgaU